MLIPLPSLAATEALAARLAPLFGPRDVVALRGDLGAGKTALARAVIQALGVDEDVPSPTFTLVQSYDAAFPIYHFDLYRLRSAEELEEIGWHESCAEGLVLVEWPERTGSFLPRNRLEMMFATDATGQRQVTLEGHGTWSQRLQEVIDNKV